MHKNVVNLRVQIRDRVVREAQRIFIPNFNEAHLARALLNTPLYKEFVSEQVEEPSPEEVGGSENKAQTIYMTLKNSMGSEDASTLVQAIVQAALVYYAFKPNLGWVSTQMSSCGMDMLHPLMKKEVSAFFVKKFKEPRESMVEPNQWYEIRKFKSISTLFFKVPQTIELLEKSLDVLFAENEADLIRGTVKESESQSECHGNINQVHAGGTKKPPGAKRM